MHANIAPKKLPSALKKYLYEPFCQNVSLQIDEYANKKSVHFAYQKPGHARMLYSGLNSWLKRRYYPTYRRPTRGKRTQKRSSNDKDGTRVDKEIQTLVQGDKVPKPHIYTKAMLEYWKKNGHRLVAAQVPTFCGDNCITQGDVITEDANHNLIYWECKTGYPPQEKKPGVLRPPYHKVRNSCLNHYFLQCYYTWQGYLDSGLPIKEAFVLHAWRERGKKGVQIQARPLPSWLTL